MFVILDEVSMVGSNMLLEIHRRLQQIKGGSDNKVFGGVSIVAEIHRRLQQIKGGSDNKVFGGVSILAVGDLYQLYHLLVKLLYSVL